MSGISSDFGSQLEKAFANIKGDIQTIYNASCLEFVNRVISRTPVKTGRLVAAWRWSHSGRVFGTPQDPVTGRFISPSRHAKEDPGYSPASLLRQIRGKAFSSMRRNMQMGRFTMSNPTAYADKAEYLGWGTREPYGMLRNTAAEWPSIVAEAIANNRRS